ncbi:MAG: endonuclease MutS2 [Eubacterium sp.]|nr:endonuclease MutS2 [Eubacterium sp.]
MNKRTLKVLEYEKILETLSGFAASQGAKRRCLRLKPYKDIVEIEKLQSETRDAMLRISKYGNLSFGGVRDIGESLKMLSIGSPLSMKELLDIAALLENADTAQLYGDKIKDSEDKSSDSLTEYFSMLSPLRDISSEIRRCIISDEEMASDASSNLRSIRRRMDETNMALHQALDKIIKDEGTRLYLMDSLVTMRNGRYCIPVKAEYKNSFQGMIHDQSSTGSTVFIEPLQVVNLNNKIKELENEEHVEIERILEELSERTATVVEEITEDLKLLITLDFIFAKAKYAKDINASEPIFNEEGIVDLKRAVHPLLERHTAVPVDIRLGEDYSLLIITGPNTGGKTVSLKTLGLLTLMGQSGLHIPAMYGSRLSVFEDVFADIGDEQSIEQNLSTFSSHMSNTIYIVKHVTDKSLCLFDEPGGGTDPQEGAALAISILTYLKNKGAKVMATTHYTELKTFAISCDGVENASCEFDVKTLRPTYKLMIGIPGSSNAFAITKRLGLPEEIIEMAKENINEDSIELEKVISVLEHDKRELEKDKADIESYKKEIEELRKSLAERNENIEDKKKEIINKAREEAKAILEDAKETADKAIKDYNRWLKDPKSADASKMEKVRSNLREKGSKLGDRNKKEVKKSGFKAADFHMGDRVMVISLNVEGHVIKTADAKGLITVEMGILNSRFPASDLMILPDEKPSVKTVKAMSGGNINKGYTFKPEINLLGKTVDEAISELEKFLDDAMLSHAAQVTIVHGKGTGALRKGIQDYLRRQKFVKSFRAGEFGEGDAGVTIVTF